MSLLRCEQCPLASLPRNRVLPPAAQLSQVHSEQWEEAVLPVLHVQEYGNPPQVHRFPFLLTRTQFRTIAERADTGPVIVLLDEVETLAVARSRISMDANPVDVHRATDAVLAQLDHLADSHPELLFIAASNFPEAIDDAFISRADLIINVDMPGREACRAILESTIKALAEVFPKTKKILSTPEFEKAAELCYGLDGRRIRKLVPSACTFSKETAADPNLLTARDLVRAAKHAQTELGCQKEKTK